MRVVITTHDERVVLRPQVNVTPLPKDYRVVHTLIHDERVVLTPQYENGLYPR